MWNIWHMPSKTYLLLSSLFFREGNWGLKKCKPLEEGKIGIVLLNLKYSYSMFSYRLSDTLVLDFASSSKVSQVRCLKNKTGHKSGKILSGLGNTCLWCLPLLNTFFHSLLSWNQNTLHRSKFYSPIITTVLCSSLPVSSCPWNLSSLLHCLFKFIFG